MRRSAATAYLAAMAAAGAWAVPEEAVSWAAGGAAGVGLAAVRREAREAPRRPMGRPAHAPAGPVEALLVGRQGVRMAAEVVEAQAVLAEGEEASGRAAELEDSEAEVVPAGLA